MKMDLKEKEVKEGGIGKLSINENESEDENVYYTINESVT